MGNPRHITQIGLPRGNRRIFLEDYVVSYMKQHKSEVTVKIALFGQTRKEENTTKYFIFGAAELPEELQEEARERIRKCYFSNYQYLGYGRLGNDLPDGFYIETEQGTSYIEGYYCFYDDNDAMLSYMIEEREADKGKPDSDTGKSAESITQTGEVRGGYPDTSDNPPMQRVSAREYRRALSQKEHRPINKLKLSVVITFLIMCAVSVRDYLTEHTVNEEKKTAQVVTESELVDALQQENVKDATNQEQTINTQEATDVSSASEEEPEREPVTFEEAAETEVTEAVSVISEAVIAEEQETTYHTVKRGETLITISIHYYGDKEQVDAICRVNGITRPDEIKEGQKLLLP